MKKIKQHKEKKNPDKYPPGRKYIAKQYLSMNIETLSND